MYVYVYNLINYCKMMGLSVCQCVLGRILLEQTELFYHVVHRNIAVRKMDMESAFHNPDLPTGNIAGFVMPR